VEPWMKILFLLLRDYEAPRLDSFTPTISFLKIMCYGQYNRLRWRMLSKYEKDKFALVLGNCVLAWTCSQLSMYIYFKAVWRFETWSEPTGILIRLTFTLHKGDCILRMVCSMDKQSLWMVKLKSTIDLIPRFRISHLLVRMEWCKFLPCSYIL